MKDAHPAGIAGVALYPTLARFSGDVAALRGKSRDALRLVLMLGALVGSGTALYADVAVSLVYKREGFAPAIDILRALGPYLFLMFVNILLGNAILAIGKARTAFTGANTSRSVWVALALLAVGTGLVVAVRQRRVKPRGDVPVA